MDKPMVSVIMPVYNVDRYLEKAIRSVLAQTFSDFELILIDDGSTDKSAEICDGFHSYTNVTVLHIPNSGVAHARNTGLKTAKGKYIAFFDSDDWVEPDMLSRMVTAAEETQSEIVVCGFHMEYYENGRELDYQVKPQSLSCNIDEFKSLFYEALKKNLLSTPWNKLYQRDFLLEHGTLFQDRLCEDIYFNLELFADIQKITFLDITPYHWYRSRPGSETAKIYSPDLLWTTKKDVYEGLVELCRKWNMCDPIHMKNINCYYTDRLVQCVQEIMASRGYKHQEKRRYIKAILSDEETRHALKIARPSSKAMKLCYVPLRLGNVTLASFMGWSITLVKTKFSTFFYNMRSKTVHECEVSR